MTLTKREQEVCDLAARGISDIEIAKQLGISRRTVEDHRQRAYVKFGVHNLIGLMHKFAELGLPCPCCGRTAA